MRAIIVLGCLLQLAFGSPVLAQDRAIVGGKTDLVSLDRGETLEAFAKDLSDINRTLPSVPEYAIMMQSGLFEELWEDIVTKAHELRERWRDNQYIEVSGFSVSIGLTGLSLDVQFQFK